MTFFIRVIRVIRGHSHVKGCALFANSIDRPFVFAGHPSRTKSAQRSRGPRILFMKSSTKDKIKGTLLEAKGKVKEESGKAVGNPNLRDRGTSEKVAGKVQKKVGDVKKVFNK